MISKILMNRKHTFDFFFFSLVKYLIRLTKYKNQIQKGIDLKINLKKLNMVIQKFNIEQLGATKYNFLSICINIFCPAKSVIQIKNRYFCINPPLAS